MFGGYEHPVLSLAKRLVNPLVIFISLIIAVVIEQQKFDGLHLLLGILAFLVASQVFDGFEFFEVSNLHGTGIVTHGRNLLVAWALVLGILSAVGAFSGIIEDYNPRVLLLWSLITPVLLFIGHSLVRTYLEMLRSNGSIRRSVIVGANELGHKLADRIHQQRSLMTRVEAFFDDRSGERCENELKNVVFGGIDDVAAYVARHEIDLVYITLPMLNHPRVLDLVNSLRDTTASIYFVPDVFMFDLVQARLDNINGIPVISVFETPLTGINAVHKRVFDVAASGLILCAIAPLMLVIAVLVKATSKGPVIFKQRRYGMDGDEILVYKFRSMCVCEDSQVVIQATQNDARVTRIGAILRRTSLDELPQFFNVLQGTMSIVGPRPHAVAHNEHYRKLIHGYMWRHKVKPGITGWAQVNGYRGETDTIGKMEGRVIYDIAYLKSWSLWLDLTIIFKTLKLVLKDAHAY
ncbi:undecaprenyl-phosphate glucose phosphotransferase [Sulfuriferula plumbiphila]|uniref:Undecaprenyl-phosphate glucose phosphotransferase n=1 Tax=Sulfuriferula plumbiphila TaxID=171865 RepID=A0A512L6A0_9PROT|nr:undecaprenyl-phosphate glucose phosphotransferase [Sulfuriferula plumbiphila]BBP03603.1 undecaprenyl-phosphate glucose phosphotransferase [Sulfuriferula plumbiphila]GEP30004.1 undecaprenyl-phosphate glucose phosphotransferase [Sulfuriferula plumbiphila]